MKGSKRWQLSKDDWKRIGIGALMAVGGAIATYLEELIPTLDFGSWTPVAVAVNGILINTIRKLITDYST